MNSEDWDLPSLENSYTYPLSLFEVLKHLKKRLKLIENLEKKNFFLKKSKDSNFEKIIEYTQRFSYFHEIRDLKNEISFTKFINQSKIEPRNFLKAKIFFCKIVDLSPSTIQEAKILLPGIEKIFNYNDIKNLIKLMS